MAACPSRRRSRALQLPFDAFLVRKLGVPGHEEFALGAIASGGVRVVNRPLVASLGLPPEWLEASEAKELHELTRRELAYRGDRPPPDVAGSTIILVDDGLATGSTMLTAVTALRQDHPARIVVAVPVASSDALNALRAEADGVVCLLTPRSLYAVGAWYEDFSQTTDDEVRTLLAAARPLASALELAGARRLTGAATDYDPLYVEQNARIVVDAERYYRAMFRGGSESWNLRDVHMADTLDALVTHLERTRTGAVRAATAPQPARRRAAQPAGWQRSSSTRSPRRKRLPTASPAGSASTSRCSHAGSRGGRPARVLRARHGPPDRCSHRRS